MSFNNRTYMPAFGISRSRSNARRGNTELQQHNPVVNSGVKIPVLNLSHSGPGQTGELILNQTDSLLYYYTGRQWIPLDVLDNDTRQFTDLLGQMIVVSDDNVAIETPDKGNLSLLAGNNPPGVGGHVHLSAGQGGLADGEIYLDVGGDRALTINKNSDMTLNTGNINLQSGSINCSIARDEVTAVTVQQKEPVSLLDMEDEETVVDEPVVEETTEGTEEPVRETEKGPEVTSLPDAHLNGMNGILTINCELSEGESVSGVIHNNILKVDSLINTTFVNCGCGVPYLWLSALQDNKVQYHIRCLEGKLTKVQLHVDVLNSV